MDPEKGFHEVHIEDNIEVILSKRKVELYNAVIEEREDFTVEAEVLREVTSTKYTILHVAAQTGNKKIAKKIIDLDPSLLPQLERQLSTSYCRKFGASGDDKFSIVATPTHDGTAVEDYK